MHKVSAQFIQFTYVEGLRHAAKIIGQLWIKSFPYLVVCFQSFGNDDESTGWLQYTIVLGSLIVVLREHIREPLCHRRCPGGGGCVAGWRCLGFDFARPALRLAAFMLCVASWSGGVMRSQSSESSRKLLIQKTPGR